MIIWIPFAAIYPVLQDPGGVGLMQDHLDPLDSHPVLQDPGGVVLVQDHQDPIDSHPVLQDPGGV